MTGKLLPPALLLLLFATVSCSSLRSNQDFWAVRTITNSKQKIVESLSVINSHAPITLSALDAQQFAANSYFNAQILLFEEGHVITRQGGDTAFTRELVAASFWLRQLAQSSRVKVLLTFVSPDFRRQIRTRHSSNDMSVIDLYVPVDQRQTASAMVRNALATSLHEASHVLLTHTDRSSEEARATLVETCFLASSMHQGDILHLRQSADQHFEGHVLRDSRRAANKIMTDLIAIVGSSTVKSTDTSALEKINAYCRSSLQPS
jgi:hypothetical protein